MGIYKHIRDAWKKPYDSVDVALKQRMIEWRKEDTTVRIERPTRLDRARSCGYKAKEGIIIVRQRIPVSHRMRESGVKGRRTKTQRRKKIVSKNYQQIAEERAAVKYPNMEVLNSYWVAEDGQEKWFEVIMVDKFHPAIIADKDLNWICQPQHEKRVFRGLTSAARRSRGLMNKGKGAEKIRPSNRARDRMAK